MRNASSIVVTSRVTSYLLPRHVCRARRAPTPTAGHPCDGVPASRFRIYSVPAGQLDLRRAALRRASGAHGPLQRHPAAQPVPAGNPDLCRGEQLVRRADPHAHLYGNFDIILGHFSRISQLETTQHAPCDMLYLVAVLIRCWPVLAIRCCDQFGAAGQSVADPQLRYGTFRLNFHHFDRFELDLRGYTQP